MNESVLLLKEIEDLCEDCCSGHRDSTFSSLIYQTANCLSQRGFSVDVLEYSHAGEPLNLSEYSVVVGFASLFYGLEHMLPRLERAKADGLKTILCLHNSFEVFERQILEDNPFIDFAALLENREQGIELLLNDLQADSFPEKSGIVYRCGDEVKSTGKRDPAAAPMDLPAFVPESIPHSLERYKTAYVTVGRGCRYGCTFCMMRKTAVRKRSVADIMSDLRHLSQYVSDFSLIDPDLSNEKDWAYELFNAIIDEDLGITWESDIVLPACFDLDFLKLLHASGCRKLACGIETLDQEGMKETGKIIREDKLDEAVKNLLSVGITPNLNFMFGFWWDNKATAQAIISCLKKYPECTTYVQMVRPYPSMPIFKGFVERDLIPADVHYSSYLKSLSSPMTATEHLSKEEVQRWYSKISEVARHRSALDRWKEACKRRVGSVRHVLRQLAAPSK